MEHIATISAELNIATKQIDAVADLLAQGGTVPFIARYRKEATGSLDEVAITAIRDRLHQLEELDVRKAAVLKSLETNGHLTDELKEQVSAAPTLAVLEDLYLPFRPKRRTKATVAREKGLEPLAREILEQNGRDPVQLAAAYVDPQKGVESVEAALEGARHIIAEIINEDPRARDRMRELYVRKGIIRSQVATDKEAEGAKYRDYFDWNEPAATAPSHRILAMRRGEKEDILNLAMAPPEADALALLEDLFVNGDDPDAAQVRLALNDGYRRLLSRAMETELRLVTKQRADEQAIRIFASNLRQLLLSPPLGARRVMGIDPGYRTGCKIVCLDRQGKLLHHETVYPHLSERQDRQAAEKIAELCRRFSIEAVAIGNGTAGRETEAFVRKIDSLQAIPVLLVNESGASIYSASEAARREFPDLDLTVRGSVSIARRLMDPLSELVKIDPKSIGVGQYQHDVDQSDLKKSLDDVVISCVNAVGVDVNRASVELLTYVSGLGPQLAANIVAVRNEKGPFSSRVELKGVPRLGPKAFEQSAGFLRIQRGANPLDASAVHPESYAVVDAMARDQDCSVAELMQEASRRKKIDLTRYVDDKIGLPTLRDILAELDKPGRDPRKDFETVAFAGHVNQISDLRPGMILPGVVTNVTAFGAFVDIGVHQDGLVHISEMADAFVKNPTDVVSVQQRVKVTVLEVDLERNRIALSMKTAPMRVKVSSENKKPRRPKRENRQPAAEKKPNRPFNNPFAEALGRKRRK
ncbi:MAG: RNA-binding transcriptional accessory protein [Desulfobacterales bacterium]|nr:RNA-binding transcriptional accessory protein [Desulfobacterales bacterium]